MGVESGGSRVPGYPQSHRKFEASLVYLRACFNEKKYKTMVIDWASPRGIFDAMEAWLIPEDAQQ